MGCCRSYFSTEIYESKASSAIFNQNFVPLRPCKGDYNESDCITPLSDNSSFVSFTELPVYSDQPSMDSWKIGNVSESF